MKRRFALILGSVLALSILPLGSAHACDPDGGPCFEDWEPDVKQVICSVDPRC